MFSISNITISDKDEQKYEDVDNHYENDDSETVSNYSFKYDDDNTNSFKYDDDNTIKASISSNLSELLGIPKIQLKRRIMFGTHRKKMV